MFDKFLTALETPEFWQFYIIFLLLFIITALITIIISLFLIIRVKSNPWSTSAISILIYLLVILPMIHVVLTEIWGLTLPNISDITYSKIKTEGDSGLPSGKGDPSLANGGDSSLPSGRGDSGLPSGKKEEKNIDSLSNDEYFVEENTNNSLNNINKNEITKVAASLKKQKNYNYLELIKVQPKSKGRNHYPKIYKHTYTRNKIPGLYHGAMKKSRPNGCGIYKNSGTTFIGQYKNGKRNGFGVYVSRNKKIIDVRYYRKGKRIKSLIKNNTGIVSLPNSKYYGTIRSNKKLEVAIVTTKNHTYLNIYNQGVLKKTLCAFNKNYLE